MSRAADPTAIFFWEPASRLTLLLLAAVFLGALPLLITAQRAETWDRASIAFVPASVMVLGLGLATATESQELAFTDNAPIMIVFLLGLVVASVLGAWLDRRVLLTPQNPRVLWS